METKPNTSTASVITIWSCFWSNFQLNVFENIFQLLFHQLVFSNQPPTPRHHLHPQKPCGHQASPPTPVTHPLSFPRLLQSYQHTPSHFLGENYISDIYGSTIKKSLKICEAVCLYLCWPGDFWSYFLDCVYTQLCRALASSFFAAVGHNTSRTISSAISTYFFHNHNFLGLFSWANAHASLSWILANICCMDKDGRKRCTSGFVLIWWERPGFFFDVS